LIRHLKSVLSLIDIGFYRISKNQSFPGFVDHTKNFDSHIDPTIHNSVEFLDGAVTLAGINKYLENRHEFYQRIINYCIQKNVILDKVSVLDAGCSGSSLLQKIREQYEPTEVTGFDFSATTLKVSKQIYPNINYKKFDLVKDVPNQSFDLVFCTQVLEHILQPEIALRNLILMTKSSGKLLLTVPNGRTDSYTGHINFWSPESFEYFIRSNTHRNCKNYQFDDGEIGLSCLLSMSDKPLSL
jgi:2-polyprenyl-3-methyl-5-hydroxy-6-metoxy-1,4-benzoquinol methylase